MANILIVSTGLTSLTNSCIELTHRLKSAGHDVTYAGPERVRATLERNNVRFVPLETGAKGEPSAPDTKKGAVPKARDWIGRIRSAPTLRARAQTDLIDPGFEPLLERFQPDLVLVELELQAYLIAAQGLAHRTAALSVFVSTRRRPGVPPLHTAIKPGHGPSGTRLGIGLAWFRYRAWKAWKHTLARIRSPGSNKIAVLRALADHVGFPARSEFVLYDWLFPLSFRTVPTLNLNPLEIDFPHQTHPSEHYAGALVRSERDDGRTQLDPQASQILDGILNNRPPSRKLVFCAFGTAFAGDDSAFLLRLLEAVQEHTEWDVLVTLGGRSIPGSWDSVPEHVHVFDWLPQIEVLARADCAVLHAGPASIYECIHFRVPMVLYPFPVNDQRGYAARAAYHGLAHLGDRERDPSSRIAADVAAALTDRAMVHALNAMADQFEEDRASGSAVRAVEALLAL